MYIYLYVYIYMVKCGEGVAAVNFRSRVEMSRATSLTHVGQFALMRANSNAVEELPQYISIVKTILLVMVTTKGVD